MWLSGPDTGASHSGRRACGPRSHAVHRTDHLSPRADDENTYRKKVRPKMVSTGEPLLRVKPKDLAAAGVERVARVTGVQDGQPQLEDGRTIDVANVVWCTGFHPDSPGSISPCLGHKSRFTSGASLNRSPASSSSALSSFIRCRQSRSTASDGTQTTSPGRSRLAAEGVEGLKLERIPSGSESHSRCKRPTNCLIRVPESVPGAESRRAVQQLDPLRRKPARAERGPSRWS